MDSNEFAACFEECRIQGEPYKTHSVAIENAFIRLDLDDNLKISESEFTVTFKEDHDEL